jgi:hypothetical protein
MNEALDVGNWADDSEYRRQRDWWWSTLKILRAEWLQSSVRLARDSRDSDFDTWVLDTQGVQIVYTNGLIAGHYEIADEKKHLVFLLKYI